MISSDFTNHPVFEKLDQLKVRIKDSVLKDVLDIENLSFFETAEKYLRDRLKLTIPTIVQESELAAISQEIEYSLNQINEYIGNSNIGHITNATNYLYTAISRVRNLPLPFSNNDFKFSTEIANFETIVKDKYKSLEVENNSLKATIEQQNIQLDATNAELSRIASELLVKENEIKNLNSTFQTDFNNIRSASTQNIDTDRSTYRTEFDNLTISFNKELTDIKESSNAVTAQIISELKIKLTEAKKIIGVIGDVSVTGNYQQIANNNKSSADIFRIIAIILMITLSAILICTIWDISGENYDWTKSLIRIIAAAALSYPATYAAQESSKHRKLETINRKAELELAAINPFIELLPENKKQEIKEKLVEKYFGNNQSHNDSDGKKDDDEVSLNALDKVLKTVLSHIKK